MIETNLCWVPPARRLLVLLNVTCFIQYSKFPSPKKSIELLQHCFLIVGVKDSVCDDGGGWNESKLCHWQDKNDYDNHNSYSHSLSGHQKCHQIATGNMINQPTAGCGKVFPTADAELVKWFRRFSPPSHASWHYYDQHWICDRRNGRLSTQHDRCRGQLTSTLSLLCPFDHSMCRMQTIWETLKENHACCSTFSDSSPMRCLKVPFGPQAS